MNSLQILWPRRVKKIIIDYSLQNQLNQENKRNIEDRIARLVRGYGGLFLLLIVASYCLTETLSFLHILGAAIISATGFHFQTREFFLRYVIPINFGERIEGRILSVVKKHTKYAHTGWHLKYEFKAQGLLHSHSVNLQSPADLTTALQPEEPQLIFYDQQSKKSIPALHNLINQCSLKIGETL